MSQVIHRRRVLILGLGGILVIVFPDMFFPMLMTSRIANDKSHYMYFKYCYKTWSARSVPGPSPVLWDCLSGSKPYSPQLEFSLHRAKKVGRTYISATPRFLRRPGTHGLPASHIDKWGISLGVPVYPCFVIFLFKFSKSWFERIILSDSLCWLSVLPHFYVFYYFACISTKPTEACTKNSD